MSLLVIWKLFLKQQTSIYLCFLCAVLVTYVHVHSYITYSYMYVMVCVCVEDLTLADDGVFKCEIDGDDSSRAVLHTLTVEGK